MSPRRRLLPILLFLLTALFIYSYHSSFNLFFPNSQSTPSTQFNLHSSPTPPNFTLTLKVLTFDRLNSLSRCLNSLANADYEGDRVNIHVFIDHFKDGNEKELDGKIEESRKRLDFVDGFVWRYGEKFVHYRTGNVGLQAQWLEAWWPSSDDEFAFVVEDDLEVSPLFYKFLKGLIVNYYYNESNYNPNIYGASLQRPRFVPGKHGNKIQLDSETRLFLYQLVGTWGQLLFPKPWKEFRLWYDTHKAKGIKPILQGMVTTGWYKKLGERIWTPWFIKFIHSRGYFNIYTNILHERALSVSNRDVGVNYGKSAGPDSQLLQELPLDINLFEMQPLSNLKWYDFCFREVLPGRIIKHFNELESVLPSIQKQKTVIFVSLFGVPETVTANLICHFEKLNIRNYILLGGDINFLTDLARRGHPVVDTVKIVKSIRDYDESQQELFVKAYLIKKCLDLGYDSWVIDGNMVPINADFLSDANKSSYEILATMLVDVLFVKRTVKIWTGSFISKMARSTRKKFSNLVAEFLRDKNAKIGLLDEVNWALRIGLNSSNGTRIGDGHKIVFWTPETKMELIQRWLGESGMWVVDGENSCTAVVCHQD
ncbi:hypothetical protein ACHQM5_019271 [Ranunculus cassubicifolius]